MPWDSRWEENPMSLVDAEMSRLKSEIRILTRERNIAEERMRAAESRLDEAQQVIEHWQDRALHAERKLPAYPDDWGKPGAALAKTPAERGLCSTCMHSRHIDHDCPRCTCSMNSGER